MTFFGHLDGRCLRIYVPPWVSAVVYYLLCVKNKVHDSKLTARPRRYMSVNLIYLRLGGGRLLRADQRTGLLLSPSKVKYFNMATLNPGEYQSTFGVLALRFSASVGMDTW